MKVEIKSGQIRLWARQGARATYGQAIFEQARRRDDFYVVSADLCQSSGLARFREEFAERFINVGIAEQNMIGVAGGLAKDGTTVFASSFAPFVTMRAGDQIRMFLGYMQLNIKIVGLGSGFIMSEFGNSHFGIEDASVIRAIPGITIISPCDGLEIFKSVEALCEYNKPAYLRLTGGPALPVVYDRDFDFQIGKAIRIKDGDDIAFIATGTMVYHTMRASEILEKKGISCAIIDMHTIKPLDIKAIDKQLNKSVIVTVEEATVVGGLGSAVAEYLAGKLKKPLQLMIGIDDCFPRAGSYSFLLENSGLTAEQISEKVEIALKQVQRKVTQY